MLRHYRNKHGQQKSKEKKSSPTDRLVYATPAEALTATINVIMYAEFDNVIDIDRNRQVLFDYNAYMNTLEIDTLLKKHPRTKRVFNGVYARNRLPDY